MQPGELLMPFILRDLLRPLNCFLSFDCELVEPQRHDRSPIQSAIVAVVTEPRERPLPFLSEWPPE